MSAFGGEDFGYYAKDDAKERLHFLFAQIEKEFDAIYMENLNRKLIRSRPRILINSTHLCFSPREARSPEWSDIGSDGRWSEWRWWWWSLVGHRNHTNI